MWIIIRIESGRRRCRWGRERSQLLDNYGLAVLSSKYTPAPGLGFGFLFPPAD